MELSVAIRRTLHGTLLLVTALLSACAQHAQINSSEPAVSSASNARTAADLQIVDCLLPGQVRKLGTEMSFLTAGRAIKTTASDCEIRGGQYVAFDRSSYSTALNVWLPQAQAGDAVAQNYVGEIYEKGLGIAPDYSQAAQWYKKSAEQGNSRAQTNIAYLLEKGLGVNRDYTAAINWYRKAAGLDTAIALDSDETRTLRHELTQSREQETSLRLTLQDTRQRLDKALRDLAKRQNELNLQRKATAKEKHALLDQQQQALASGDAERAQRLESALKERDNTVEQANAELEKLKRETDEYRNRVAALEQQSRRTSSAPSPTPREPAPAQKIQVAQKDVTQQTANPAETEEDITGPSIEFIGPKIEIIEPPVTLNRGLGPRIKGGTENGRTIVGKVTSSLGIRELTVNDRNAPFDEDGMFHTSIPSQTSDTPVNVVAIDNGGKRAQVDFILVPERGTDPADTAYSPKVNLPAIDATVSNYALLIGNNDYQHLPTLHTPANDVRELGKVLQDRYGFKVRTLINGTRLQILSTLHALRESLDANDNLIVFYAGHGELDRVNNRGHWLPVDAERSNPGNWISNVDITDTINIMPARHVLVIADSCYSGTLTRSALTQMQDPSTTGNQDNWFKVLDSRRSRTVLSSGGAEPVPDSSSTDTRHSRFASALLQVLQVNNGVLEGARLYREVAARIAYATGKGQTAQKPEYAPVKFAGHEAGDFLLSPVR